MRASSARVRLGSFEVDLRSGELRSLALDGPADKVVLREQPFQVLRMLVEREGKIVTRSEIKTRLWPNDTIVDFDHSINTAIKVLRRALGDSAASPRYIETLARRGYRLLQGVEWLDSNAPAAEVAATCKTSRLADLTGKRVCQYRVLEMLGGGGMGMVYKAEDLKLGRPAALKFLPEELADDPIALQRLEREAQTASALNHPNICTIYDIEEYLGQPFIAMELLEGETLQQRLTESGTNAIPVRSLIDIAEQVCLGLEAAHHKDIVHRDIKPANIFLTKHGVKLLDFGVAKLIANEAVANGGVVANEGTCAPPSVRPHLTRTGVTPGTTGYMSPEQIRKEELDRRSDLFSLGLVLYEMTTGRRAFTGDTAVVVQEAILTKTPPPVESQNSATPASLATVIRKALEKDPSQRYQTATAMRHDLERVRETLLQSERRRTSRWVAAAAAALVAAGAVAWLSARHATRVTLNPDDTIVIAHVTNATDDHVLDEAVLTALRIALEQTPYVNVLFDNKVHETLTSIGIDSGGQITPEVALQVCRHTGSRLVVAPRIADAGNRLGVELKAIDCRSGSTISEIRTEAASRDGIVAALGSAALQLRRTLGEPKSSLAFYSASLQDATSPSPDALELLTLGYRQRLSGHPREAIQFYQRAVEVDPHFALAQAALSTAYYFDDTPQAAAWGVKAFEQRGRLTAPARFNVESIYHNEVTGDLHQSCDVLSQWVQAFPHDLIARHNFWYCLSALGQHDRALGEAREAARLLPSADSYFSCIYESLLADRLDEAQTTMDEAIRRGFDASSSFRYLRVLLAFVRQDDVAMRRQWAIGTGSADRPQDLFLKARIEAYHGQFGAAHRSAQKATELAVKASYAPDNEALDLALMHVDVGLTQGRSVSIDAKQTLPVRLLGTLLLARSGHREEAIKAADELRREYPSNTMVQEYGLPLIDAALRLRSNDAVGAVAVLDPVKKYDLADMASVAFYSSYLRGLAYLQMGDNAAAATEFRKILAHPGFVRWELLGALARLQLARAQRAMGEETAALNSYRSFLALWQNADSDIPLYQEAKAEYNASRHRTADGRRF